jgi:hypothetical protein
LDLEEPGFRGWDTLREFIQNRGRYQRLDNYIEMRLELMEELEQERQREEEKKAKLTKGKTKIIEIPVLPLP